MNQTPLPPRPHRAGALTPPARQGTWIVLCGVFLLLVFALQLRPIQDVDIFWQVKLGQLMIATGELVEHDVFTYTHAGAPTPTLGWLAQVIYAWLYDLGGWRAIQMLHATLFAAAFGIAGLTASRMLSRGRYPVPFSLLSGLVLGLLPGLSNAGVRPHSFALLGFAAVLYLARQGPFTVRGLVGIALIAILWQNTHPSLSLGVLAVGALAAGEWLTKWRHPEHPPPRFLTLATGILALAQLATPMGWQIFDVSAANLHISRDLLRIDEWLPPWDPRTRSAKSGFFLASGITLILLIARGRNLRPADWLLLLAMTGMAGYAARFALFWGIALIPLWTQWLEAVRPADRLAWTNPTWSPRALRLSGLGGLAAVYTLPTLIQAKPHFHYDVAECLGTLAKAVPAGHIYNFREWGGPLILQSHPQWQVTIDGRLYLYPVQDWLEYTHVAQGRVELEEIMARYKPTAFVLHPGFHRRLIELLEASGQYRRLFSDRFCVAYAPR